MKPARVFLSYSHDSPEHQYRVVQLANSLRRSGVDAVVDCFVSAPPSGWKLWMTREINQSDFTLMICTETYLRHIESPDKTEGGDGTLWEANVIYNSLDLKNSDRQKFIPVLLPGSSEDHIPRAVRGFQFYRLTENFDGYEDLLRHLTNQPKFVIEPIGPVKEMPPVYPDSADQRSAGPDLPASEQARIMDALMRFRELNDPAERALVINRLAFASDVAEHPDQRSQIGDLTDACARANRGFDELVEAVLGSSELHLLLDALQNSAREKTPLSWQEIAALKRIFKETSSDEIPWPEVKKSYAEALGGRHRLDIPLRANPLFFAIDEAAAQSVRSDRTHALLDFVERLQPAMTADGRKRSHEWLGEVSSRRKWSCAEALRRKDYGVPCLMLVLTPAAGHMFDVKAWLIRGEQVEPLGDTKPTQYEALRGELDALCDQAFRLLDGEPEKKTQLAIEAFLPDTLLGCDIDQWPARITGPSRVRPIGSDLVVVARSHSRVYDYGRLKLGHGQWVVKWRDRPKPPQRLTSEHVYCAEQEADVRELYDRLKEAYAFVGLHCISAPEAADALDGLVDSGVPVALWSRIPGTGSVSTTELMNAFLCSCDFDAIPRSVLRSRGTARIGEKSDDCVRQLVLLWEDPTRVPPDSLASYPKAGAL